MNIIWSTLIFFSILFLIIKGDFNLINIATNSIQNSLNICVELGIIYIFWCGILQIVEDCNIGIYLSKLLNPILKRIFPYLSQNAYAQISLNISTNMLGIGNASLPAGLKALDEINNLTSHKNLKNNQRNTNLFITLNCISIQIVPTTVLSLYANAGGQDFAVLWLGGIFISSICFFFAIVFNSKLKHHNLKFKNKM